MGKKENFNQDETTGDYHTSGNSYGASFDFGVLSGFQRHDGAFSQKSSGNFHWKSGVRNGRMAFAESGVF